MSDRAAFTQPAAAPRIEYLRLDPAAPLPPNLLAAVAFADTQVFSEDSRRVMVGFRPLRGAGLVELWHGNGPIVQGREGQIRFAADADYLFGILELDERQQGGIAGAAQMAYAAIRRFLHGSEHPHLLRMWNHFDGINRGKGDQERYRQFCIGRASGLGTWRSGGYPAATAIGRRDGDPKLQIFWLAGRAAGMALENPRQVNPDRYPRAYGPMPPQFSRAMLVSSELLMISGTASIVGHTSCHAGDPCAQLEESLVNLKGMLHLAAKAAPRIPPLLTEQSLIKVYLRDASALEGVESALRMRIPPGVPYMILEADICREDLLVEIDCTHAARAPP